MNHDCLRQFSYNSPAAFGSALKPWFSESRPWQRPWPQELWGASGLSGLSGLWAAGILVMIIGMAMAINGEWIIYLTLFNHVINKKKAGAYHNYNIISVILSCCQYPPNISKRLQLTDLAAKNPQRSLGRSVAQHVAAQPLGSDLMILSATGSGRVNLNSLKAYLRLQLSGSDMRNMGEISKDSKRASFIIECDIIYIYILWVC